MSGCRSIAVAVALACTAASSCTPRADPFCAGVVVPYESSFDLARTPGPDAADGFLIPGTLEEALVELERMLPAGVSRSMGCGTEEEMAHYHMGFGMWVRNEWGLWAGGALAEYFNDIGIQHADDMSGIILHSYWRRLNERPLELEAQVAGYQAYWEAHVSPGAFTCPGTGLATEPTMSFVSQRPPEPWVIYHVVDCGEGGFWSYERSEGWRRASREVLKRVAALS